MGIQQFIEKVCVQTAVYWGNPVNNGKGGKTFDYPVEISCRWDGKERLIKDSKGREILSKASVLVTADYDIGGYLYLGELTDLESNPIDPNEIEEAYEIIAIDKIPMIKSKTVFVRTVYLGFGNVG